MVTYFTYILQSKRTGRLYIGQTDDLKDRIIRHNENRVRSTKNRGPWNLIKAYRKSSRSEAIKLERYLKSLKSPDAVLNYIKDNPE